MTLARNDRLNKPCEDVQIYQKIQTLRRIQKSFLIFFFSFSKFCQRVPGQATTIYVFLELVTKFKNKFFFILLNQNHVISPFRSTAFFIRNCWSVGTFIFKKSSFRIDDVHLKNSANLILF